MRATLELREYDDSTGSSSDEEGHSNNQYLVSSRGKTRMEEWKYTQKSFPTVRLLPYIRSYRVN
jgi:hypothetical protein